MLRYGILAAVVWVIGLVAAVPLAVYYLLFHAPREQYAVLITFILGWPLGYWSIVGPILMLLKLRSHRQSTTKSWRIRWSEGWPGRTTTL